MRGCGRRRSRSRRDALAVEYARSMAGSFGIIRKGTCNEACQSATSDDVHLRHFVHDAVAIGFGIGSEAAHDRAKSKYSPVYRLSHLPTALRSAHHRFMKVILAVTNRVRPVAEKGRETQAV